MGKKHLGARSSHGKKRGGVLQKREPSTKRGKGAPEFLRGSSFEGNTDLNVTDAEWSGGEFMKY